MGPLERVMYIAPLISKLGAICACARKVITTGMRHGADVSAVHGSPAGYAERFERKVLHRVRRHVRLGI